MAEKADADASDNVANTDKGSDVKNDRTAGAAQPRISEEPKNSGKVQVRENASHEGAANSPEILSEVSQQRLSASPEDLSRAYGRVSASHYGGTDATTGGSGRPSNMTVPRTSNSQDPNKNPDALETALDKLGAFGLYQRYMALMLCIPNLFAAMYSLNYVFVADAVPFRCLVPECEGGLWMAHFDNSTAQALLPAARCQRYQPLADDTHSCLRQDFHPQYTISCDKLIYENYDTIFGEFDLGCREWLRTLVGTVRASALPLALLLTGFISDKYGRRTAFCIFSACAGALGLIKGLSVSYEMYLVMEFFEAALGYGFNSAAYVMMVELACPSLRAAFACATGVTYGLGGMLFALAAWAVPHWRHLLWTIYTPALLLPLYWLIVDESPRWLHASGRTHRAAVIIKRAARINKVRLNPELLKAVEEDVKVEEKTRSKNPWLRLVKSRRLMLRFLACCWCWVAVAFVYYGLTINSVALAGDKYVNFALNMAMEVAASLFIVMALERFGRKWSIFTAFLLCGVACVVPFFVSHSGVGQAFYFIGKLAITFAFNSMYLFTAELFPTDTRSSALAACSLVGRLGNILAPQTPLLSLYIQALLYGGCSLTAAIAVLMVRETRRAPLPQSVNAAETMAPEDECPAPLPPPPRRPPILSADL